MLCHSSLQDLEQTLLSSSVSRRALQKAFPLSVLQTFFTCHCLTRTGGLRGMLTGCPHLAFTHCIQAEGMLLCVPPHGTLCRDSGCPLKLQS